MAIRKTMHDLSETAVPTIAKMQVIAELRHQSANSSIQLLRRRREPEREQND